MLYACVLAPAHSGFGSNLEQFSSKLKCHFFFKIVSYGQIRASGDKLLNLKASCTSKARVMLTCFVKCFSRPV